MSKGSNWKQLKRKLEIPHAEVDEKQDKAKAHKRKRTDISDSLNKK